MFRVIVFLLVFCVINSVQADVIKSSSFGRNYNGFNSRLKMNQPSKRVITHRNYNRPQYDYYPHCPECHYHQQHHIPKRNLSALERHALDKTYNGENSLQRLERLENLAFGSIQSGDLASRYRNVETAILSRPQANVKRSIIGNIANYFAGQATGFTPSINPGITNGFTNLGGFSNNFYPTPGYSNNNFEQYSNGLFGGHGWGYAGQDYGTGNSIRILD